MPIHFRRLQQIALWCLLLSLLLIPSDPRVSAQEQPETAPASAQTSTASPEAAPGEPSAPSPSAENPLAPVTPPPVPTMTLPSGPAAFEPRSSAEQRGAPAEAAPALLQGVIRLDVVLPATLRPGEDLIYTYIYTNTTGSPYTNVVLQATWTNFSQGLYGDWQFCGTTDPDPFCAVVTRTNSSVAKMDNCPSGLAGNATLCYNIGSVAPNEAGRFTVRLHTHPQAYPITNGQPLRPAGSARLYTNSAGAPISEDTAATLIVSPLLSISKTTDASKLIYPTKEDNPPASEVVEFTITVGNATGANDRDVNGVYRTDARPATNVTVYDVIPQGSKYISSTPAGVVDTTKGVISWKLPGTLAVGATSTPIKVRFRKDDSPAECGRLNNKVFYATSDEYPVRLDDPTYRYGSPYGQEIGVNVAPVLYLPDGNVVPAQITYGDQSEVTIYLRNYWKNTVTGKLRYDLQNNVKYIANTALPVPSQPPDTTQFGAAVVWDFSIAGTPDRTKPTEQVFKLKVIAGYFQASSPGVASVQISDSSVPVACIGVRSLSVNVVPRLVVRKYTEADNPFQDGHYIVKQNEPFPYVLEVRNDSSSNATGIQIVDTFPGNDGARFTYMTGSGDPAPSVVNTTVPGSLVWNNINVPAKSKVLIRYKLIVTGLNYKSYCNKVAASLNQEAIAYISNSVCVKIRPALKLVKKVVSPTPPNDGSNPIVQRGSEVTYQIELTNMDAQTFKYGIGDSFAGVEYVSVVSSYSNTPPVFSDNNKLARWPLVDLAPGASVKVVVKARVPSTCVNATYDNIGFFYNEDNNGAAVSESLSWARVQVNCGSLFFAKYANRNEASLQDRVYYGLALRNDDGNAASNIVVRDVLPQGFTYEAMDSTSRLLTPPTSKTRTDGRIELSWTVPSVAARSTYDIKYVARTGQVVGKFSNWMIVPSANCGGNCNTDGQGTLYSEHIIDVKPLITMEPKINTAACAVPGDTRVYTLSILNTNNVDYTKTIVSVELPLGLTFSRVLSGTTQPSVLVDTNGVSNVIWSNLRIAAKPDNQPFTQYTLQIELKVGNVWGNLDTKVTTSSADGAIPRKENASDPTIPVCPASPSIAKAAGRATVDVGGKLMYQISLANPGAAISNVTVKDVLPKDMDYDSMEAGGTPQISTDKKTLTWTVNLPAGTAAKPGVVILRYRAKVSASAAINSKQTNTVTATSTPALQTTVKGVNVTSATVTVVKTRNYFLPMIRRT